MRTAIKRRDTGPSDHAELLARLRRYLGVLRGDPHNLPARVAVAGLQLRLGRLDEAAVHYDGAVRAYADRGDISSAIALCEELLAGVPEFSAPQQGRASHGRADLGPRSPRLSADSTGAAPGYPQLQSIHRQLAALYALAPRNDTRPCSAITSGEFRSLLFEGANLAGEDDPHDSPTVRSVVPKPPDHGLDERDTEVDGGLLVSDIPEILLDDSPQWGQSARAFTETPIRPTETPIVLLDRPKKRN